MMYCFQQGGLVGLISGLVITLWVGIGAQLYPPLPEKILRLPLSVEGCIAQDVNVTTTMTPFSTVLQTTTPQLVVYIYTHTHTRTTNKEFVVSTIF